MLHKRPRGGASYTLARDTTPDGFRLDGEAGAAEYTLERPFASLLSTTRDVLLSPRRFFDDLAPDGPLWPPVIYFLICHLATTLINLVATAAIFAVPAVFLALTDPKEITSVAPIVLGVFVLVHLAFSALVAVLFFASVLLQHVSSFCSLRGASKGA